MTTTPRIYVASLADYNNAHLHGVWIDATQDVDAINEEIAEMLRDSKYPNVMVECPTCNGSGVDAPTGLPIGDVVPTCATCNGAGKVPSAEEFAIHDHEGFEGVKVDQHDPIVKVATLAKLLDEHGDAFAAYYTNGDLYAVDPDEWEDRFTECYRGTYSSLGDYAEEITRECHEIPDYLDFYIDWDHMGKDMERNGDIWSAEGGRGVHIFTNC